MSEQQQSKEEPQQKEILIPPHVAKAFGQGLRQLLTEELKEVQQGIQDLEQTLSNQPSRTDSNFTSALKRGLEQVMLVITGLEKAKEVKLAPSIQQGLELKFSKETEETPVAPGEVIIEEDLIPSFATGFTHSFGTPQSLIKGYSELLSTRASSETVRQAAKRITDCCDVIEQKAIMPFRQNLSEIRINTNQNGDTSIIPKSKQ